MISRLMIRRAPRHRVSASRTDSVPWGRLTAITLGVMTLGIVAGAAFAAPGELLPIARSAGGAMLEASGPVLTSARTWSEQIAATFSQAVTSVLDGRVSPRTLAMIVISVLAGVFGLAAAVLSYRSRRTSPRSASATNLSLSAAPLSNNRRGAHPTPKQVLTLAQQGASLSDIARRTGMPVDAVSVLLAIADPARQLPPTTA
jgi:DNA-binding NarL/FixJ family response regulator